MAVKCQKCDRPSEVMLCMQNWCDRLCALPMCRECAEDVVKKHEDTFWIEDMTFEEWIKEKGSKHTLVCPDCKKSADITRHNDIWMVKCDCKGHWGMNRDLRKAVRDWRATYGPSYL